MKKEIRKIAVNKIAGSILNNQDMKVLRGGAEIKVNSKTLAEFYDYPVT